MKITEKYVLNLILSILLIFSLIGVGVTAFAKYDLLTAESFIESSDENNVPKIAYDEINDYFTKSVAYSGIPAEVYMSAITEEDVESIISCKMESILTYIYAVGAGESDNLEDMLKMEGFDTQALEKSITDYFNKFAKENNVQVDDAYNAQLQKTIDTAISEIDNFTDVYMLKLIAKTGMFGKVRAIYPYIDYAMYGCIGLAAVCVIIMLIASIKNFARFLYWISVSAVCAAAIGLAPTLYLKISGITDRLIIGNKTVYTAYTGFMNNCIDKLLTAEVIILAVAVVILVMGFLIAKSKNKKEA